MRPTWRVGQMDEQMATVLKLMAEVDEHDDDESEFSSCFEWASRFDNDEGGAQALREIVEPLTMAARVYEASEHPVQGRNAGLMLHCPEIETWQIEGTLRETG